MTDDQIKHMVNRFLMWKLPERFQPDAGISFEPEFNVEYNASRGLPPQRHEPTGTNLFDYTQAEAMVRHMADGVREANGLAEIALRPFAQIAERILAEAPSNASRIVLFTDCQQHAHTVSMDDLRAAVAASKAEA